MSKSKVSITRLLAIPHCTEIYGVFSSPGQENSKKFTETRSEPIKMKSSECFFWDWSVRDGPKLKRRSRGKCKSPLAAHQRPASLPSLSSSLRRPSLFKLCPRHWQTSPRLWGAPKCHTMDTSTRCAIEIMAAVERPTTDIFIVFVNVSSSASIGRDIIRRVCHSARSLGDNIKAD